MTQSYPTNKRDDMNDCASGTMADLQAELANHAAQDALE
jgi:hypothetical protein